MNSVAAQQIFVTLYLTTEHKWHNFNGTKAHFTGLLSAVPVLHGLKRAKWLGGGMDGLDGKGGRFSMKGASWGSLVPAQEGHFCNTLWVREAGARICTILPAPHPGQGKVCLSRQGQESGKADQGGGEAGGGWTHGWTSLWGGGARIQHLCLILAPIPILVGPTKAPQICTNDFAVAP